MSTVTGTRRSETVGGVSTPCNFSLIQAVNVDSNQPLNNGSRVSTLYPRVGTQHQSCLSANIWLGTRNSTLRMAPPKALIGHPVKTREREGGKTGKAEMDNLQRTQPDLTHEMNQPASNTQLLVLQSSRSKDVP